LRWGDAVDVGGTGRGDRREGASGAAAEGARRRARELELGFGVALSPNLDGNDGKMGFGGPVLCDQKNTVSFVGLSTNPWRA